MRKITDEGFFVPLRSRTSGNSGNRDSGGYHYSVLRVSIPV